MPDWLRELLIWIFGFGAFFSAYMVGYYRRKIDVCDEIMKDIEKKAKKEAERQR